jgi:uncharacterized OsmC-like protein
MTTSHTDRDPRQGNLLLPAGPPRALAIYAFRAHRAEDPQPASALPAALAGAGIGVLALDLGSSDFPAGAGPSQDDDAAAVRRAVDTLRAGHGEPALLIGHSAAGPAVLAAAASMTGVRAVVTVGSPAPQPPRRPGVPLLVLHAPHDPVVPLSEASRIFEAAGHPKSFVALDGVDHAVSEPRQARHVAALIAAWAEPYLPVSSPTLPAEPDGSVVVAEAGTGRYSQTILAGRHVLAADEPVSAGGTDAGPNPYELLLAALGACTSMTLRMYADHKGLPLRRTTVRLRHDRVHAADCTQTEHKTGMLSRIRREIELEGELSDEDRARLMEVADRCPVHRTLSSEIVLETTDAAQ